MSTFDGLVKELPGISVDHFEADNLDSSAFFLSHCHTDHMRGLRFEFFEHLQRRNRYLYCSSISKLILEDEHRLPSRLADRIMALEDCKPTSIRYEDPSGLFQYVSVCSISSGHCPGSVMFLFEQSTKTLLYTGDVRIHSSDISKLKPLHFPGSSIPREFDAMYLDTTFLNEHFKSLPSRKEALDQIYKLIQDWLDENPMNVILLECSANYGSEFLFMNVSRSFKTKIHVKEKVYEKYKRIEELNHYVTDNANETRIHACIERKFVDLNCRKVYSKNVLRIVPSVQWWKGKDTSIVVARNDKRFNTINVCYSNHSSYNELKDFITYFNANNVIPCVNSDNQKDLLSEILKELKKQTPEVEMCSIKLPRFKNVKLDCNNKEYCDDENSDS